MRIKLTPVKPCTKGPGGKPCGRAAKGPRTPEQCPRCWINLHLASELRVVAKVPPRPITVKRVPLKIAHADRCESFTGRTEFREGCKGWKCRGGCSKGLPAVPGVFCQTCEAYAADPDYQGLGSAGWLG